VEREQIVLLLQKYLRDTLSPKEAAQLEDWANRDAANRQLLANFDKEEWLRSELLDFHAMAPANLERESAQLSRRIIGGRNVRSLYYKWLPYAVAAILAMAIGVFFLDNDKKHNDHALSIEVPPGGHRATLSLTDGRTIVLNEATEGIVVYDDRIAYRDGSALAATIADTLVLTTPRGGQYRITLADGTNVWLNAASTLKYPAKFSGSAREVKLTGQAYFAVSEDKQRPFRVQTDAQQVEVLGTEFDISAYADDKETRTTLVTGSVRLSQAANELVLMPGEQGKLRNSIFTKKQVDVNAYIAWTHGDMVFDQTDLSQIFRQLERWYDVNFIFDNIRPEGQLYGKLSRQTNLSDVLRVIGRNTGLRFKITENQKGERRVRVYK